MDLPVIKSELISRTLKGVLDPRNLASLGNIFEAHKKYALAAVLKITLLVNIRFTAAFINLLSTLVLV